MVGVFSKLSRARLRRTQSAIDERQVILLTAEEIEGSVAAAATSHGIEVAVEFKPVEHPIEPLDNDQPVRCPQPEPSIINDGRIWKERLSATVRSRADLAVMKEGSHLENEAVGTKARPSAVNRSALPSSISAPEHNLIHLLEECREAGD